MQTQSFFENASTAQMVIDPIYDLIIAANQEMHKLSGHSEHTITKHTVSQLFSLSFSELIVFTEEVMEKQKAWCNHLLLNSSEGYIHVEVTGCLGKDSKLYLTLYKTEDVDNHRKKSDAHQHYISGIHHWNHVSLVFQEFERENQLILDSVGEGIYGIDQDGLTTFINPAAERILGYKADELAGRNMHSMVHHSHADGSHFCANDCPIYEAIRDGIIHTVEDDVFWSKSGKAIDVEYTSTPIYDNGFIVGAVVIFHDVSQKKKDKKRLIGALKQVETLKNQLELENAYLQEEIGSEFNHHQIIGKSRAIQHIVQQIKMVAPTEATVLVYGESGTGKELLARAIHDMSDRSHRPLIRVNCAAIPDDLFESEFFGHAKGAFTGATSDRPGRFEVADGGTIFLDEVGELPLHLQGKLLRVIQEQQFERVGESKTRHVNVRIIAATNRDLKRQVLSEKFREDLYFRLNVFPIESIPLRNRKDDISLLTQHFLKKSATRAKKQDLKIPLSEIEKLKSHNWPGNIRELENIIERQVILSQSDIVKFNNLFDDIPATQEKETKEEKNILTSREIKNRDRKNLISALEKCNGKVFGKNGVAELLGMKPTTVSSRIKKMKLNIQDFRKSEQEHEPPFI